MPTYGYKCDCGLEFEIFYKSLPSEKLQTGAVCGECGKRAARVPVASFMTGGTQSTDIQKAVGVAMKHADQGGRPVPVFRDANGQVHEVKDSGDIALWQKSNQLGVPRMVNWRNPITGETKMVPQRTVMKVDPSTGEPADLGAVVRESEKIVPLGGAKEYALPTASRTGRPMKNGVLVERDASKIRSRFIDPETGKPATLAGNWGDDRGIPSGRVKNAK